MASEREWVEDLGTKLETGLQHVSIKGTRVRVACHRKLAYAHEIFGYEGGGNGAVNVNDYQTDILVFDEAAEGRWVPRVVVESKLGRVTTHDALTYSTKAAAHKQVHPYLRYGILIGDLGEDAVPGRLLRHGAHFDFMVTWATAEPDDDRWCDLTDLLGQEIKASRKLQRLLADTRSRERLRYSMIHRPLRLKQWSAAAHPCSPARLQARQGGRKADVLH